jgi:hypothetical protein
MNATGTNGSVVSLPRRAVVSSLPSLTLLLLSGILPLPGTNETRVM